MSQGLRHFGKYLLVRRLGSGRRGQVFLGQWRGPAGFFKSCAIKILAAAPSERFRKSFVEGARLAVQLSHANVVQVLDFGNIEDKYYLCLEYVEGQDLSRLLERSQTAGQRLPLDVVLTVLRGTLAGLAYAHQRTDAIKRPLAMVHQALSPQNILLSYEGEVKVSDFGIINMSPTDGTEIISGADRYLSPEQTQGLKPDPRSDLYALGVIFHEMLTNQRVPLNPPAPSPVSFPLPPRRESWIPIEVEAILRKSLDVNREARFASADQMLEAINHFCRSAVAVELAGLISPALIRLADTRHPLAGLDQHGRRVLSDYLQQHFHEERARQQREQEALQRYLQGSRPREIELPLSGDSHPAHRWSLAGLLEVQASPARTTRPFHFWRYAKWLLLPAVAGLVAVVYQQRDTRTPEEKKAETRAQEKALLWQDMEALGLRSDDEPKVSSCLRRLEALEKAGQLGWILGQTKRCRRLVEQTAIDQPFLERKLARVKVLLRRNPALASETRTLFDEAAALSSQGQYAPANQRLNQILRGVSPAP